MKLGIFMKIFTRPRWQQSLDVITDMGIQWIHFTLQPIVGEALPHEVDARTVDQIRRELTARGLKIATFSGTFNMAHPDEGYRREYLARFSTVCSVCRDLGGAIVAVCTGTRDPLDMWRWHPENQTPQAWEDMSRTMEEALTLADRYQVILAFEPEANNVVDSPQKAQRLLEEFQHPRLRVILDPVNILPEAGSIDRNQILEQAVRLLGPSIVAAHAKDVVRTGMAAKFGEPLVDYSCYLQLLSDHGFDGALLIHSVAEHDVPQVIAFLRNTAGKSKINLD
ncbi:sugar phosphate isomerase/epimerase [Thermogutta sp.]|uniref:sugar phosphate isomerase/epimerase family protein n=1 Tax=Thermogutta sp. TaxID=1962930 RepID=UPI00321FE9E7